MDANKKRLIEDVELFMSDIIKAGDKYKSSNKTDDDWNSFTTTCCCAAQVLKLSLSSTEIQNNPVLLKFASLVLFGSKECFSEIMSSVAIFGIKCTNHAAPELSPSAIMEISIIAKIASKPMTHAENVMLLQSVPTCHDQSFIDVLDRLCDINDTNDRLKEAEAIIFNMLKASSFDEKEIAEVIEGIFK